MRKIVFGKCVQGASHIRSGTECQDSCKKVILDDGTIILAVADGHGSKSSPYSAAGSRIAVNVFCETMKRLYEGFMENPEQLPSFLNREGETQVSKTIDAEWKRCVAALHRENKRDIGEPERIEENQVSVYRQYGSTLLGLMITKTFVFGFQLGDGDICYVNENGLEVLVKPEKILGVETHSLSRENSWEKASTVVRRICVEDKLPAMFSLSTDGYANSYETEEEFHITVKEYLSLMEAHGSKAVCDSLPGWLSETSQMGCGDDITMLIAYFTQNGDEEAACI